MSCDIELVLDKKSGNYFIKEIFLNLGQEDEKK
jgi:hypothetical protein